MKLRVLSLVAVVAVVATTLLTGCADKGTTGEQTPGKVYELTYSNFFAATHYHSVLAEQWIAEIQKRSKNRVKISYFPGGTLAKGPQTYDAVVQGICDIGMSVLAYTAGRFPTCELVDLPHGYPSGWVATQVANDYYNKFKPKEFDDTHALYFHAHGPGVVFTTQKPVRSLADMKGLVIRGTGVGVQIMEALGAKGYGASQAEAYELLSKNVVNGSFSPREVLKGWNQAEVVKYVTGCYDVGNTSMMFVVMNKSKWESLPADIQKIFTDVSKEWIDKHGKVWNYYDDVAVTHFKSLGQGREVIELSRDEMAQWVKVAVDPLIQKYTDDKTKAGLPAAEYQKYLLERVEYWKKKAPTDAQSKSFVESEVVNWKPSP